MGSGNRMGKHLPFDAFLSTFDNYSGLHNYILDKEHIPMF